MKKVWKVLAALATIGAVIGIIVALVCKKNECGYDSCEDESEDETFTIDDDLKAAEEREYVSLKKSVEEDTASEEADKSTDNK